MPVKSSSKKYEIQQALTWNMRCLRSGFGKQVYSANRTEPGAGIGSSNRDAFLQGSLGPQPDSQRPNSARCLIGNEPRLRPSPSSWVPGPGIYKTENSIGPQKDSRRASSAKATFGAETRDGRNKQFMDEEMEKAFYGKWSPGPMVYNTIGSFGKQPLSTKETGGRCKIGTEDRFRYDFVEVAKKQPGAGQYNNHLNALGKQIRSRSKTLPAYGFGTSTRDGMKKVFISMDHEKQNFGVGTPGPTTANKTSAFYIQKMSQKKSAPGWGFGTSARLPRNTGDGSPGPGTYCA